MKAIKEIETVGRQTLLAGTGVVGESLDKATDKLDNLYVNGNAFVCDLVSRGEAVESQLKAKLNERFKGKEMIQDKIAMLKQKLGMSNRSRDIQLEKLSTKVDNLIEVVAKLAQQKAAEQAKTATTSNTTAARKPAAKKPAATKATTAKKPATKPATATKKPAATKSSTSKTAAKAPAKPRAKATAAKKATDDKP